MIFKNLILIILFSVKKAAYPQAVKWMAIGDLQNWYSAAGARLK